MLEKSRVQEKTLSIWSLIDKIRTMDGALNTNLDLSGLGNSSDFTRGF